LKKILLLLCLISISCVAQKGNTKFDKIKFDKELTHTLFTSTEYMLNPLTLKTEHGYDNVEDSTQYVIQSNVMLDKDEYSKMRFVNVKRLEADTLELTIHETSPAHHLVLTTKIKDEEFTSSFRFSTVIKDMKVNRLKQKLTLISIPQKKGDTIYGKIYYKGVCESDCDSPKPQYYIFINISPLPLFIHL